MSATSQLQRYPNKEESSRECRANGSLLFYHQSSRKTFGLLLKIKPVMMKRHTYHRLSSLKEEETNHMSAPNVTNQPTPTYYPPGWNRERLLNSSRKELLSLPTEVLHFLLEIGRYSDYTSNLTRFGEVSKQI